MSSTWWNQGCRIFECREQADGFYILGRFDSIRLGISHVLAIATHKDHYSREIDYSALLCYPRFNGFKNSLTAIGKAAACFGGCWTTVH